MLADVLMWIRVKLQRLCYNAIS